MALKGLPDGRAEITGYARRPEMAERALRLGAVDRVDRSLASAVEMAELIILAVPTMAMKEILTGISPYLNAGSVVTDVASTKLQVMEWAEQSLPSNVSFVGGHPMAGKEFSGIEVADASLFRGCTYCVVPGRDATDNAIHAVVEMAEKLGAHPIFLAAGEHDYFVAGVSHLPMILASALVAATTGDSRWSRMAALAATGYLGTSRLASQHPRMERDICLTNGDNIVAWIDRFSRELQQFRHLITEGDLGLEQAFEKTRQARNGWIEQYGKKA